MQRKGNGLSCVPRDVACRRSVINSDISRTVFIELNYGEASR
jgi:hypothetical protein